MEQSYKEKYEQALAKAKEQYNYPCMRSCMGILEEIFPELAESEDEKIRKELISFFSDLPDTDTFRGIPPSKVIAWLEKQKEYESTDFEYVWDRTDCGELTAALDKYSEEAIINMCHAWYDKGIELERKSWLEKQGQVKESTISQHEIETCKDNVNSLTFEDEKVRKTLIDFFGRGAKYGGQTNGVYDKDIIAWLEKQGKTSPVLSNSSNNGKDEQKQEWSEEEDDDAWMNDIISKVENNLQLNKAEIDWLKSLKLQPKQSLDEDTQQWVDTIIKDYEDLYNTDKDHSATIQAKISILKSLRPQNTWKPSDEQIKVCKEVYADLLSAKGFDLGTVVSELNRLEEGLKKKGE